MKLNKDLVLINLLRDLGTPYIWGGSQIKTGVDCSGFVQLKLADYGLDPDGDQTAQALYDHFKTKAEAISTKSVGNFNLWDLLFFGASVKGITHVAIALDHGLMVEAGGGGSKTTTKAIAEAQGAKVRVSNVLRRSDLVACLRLNAVKEFYYE